MQATNIILWKKKVEKIMKEAILKMLDKLKQLTIDKKYSKFPNY